MSVQGLAQNDQKCKFPAKFGRFLAKIPNFFTGESKSFGTNITEKPILGQIWPFMGQKS